MRTRTVAVGCAILTALALLVQGGGPSPSPMPTKPKLAVSIKPQAVTDALHVLISTDRAIYTARTAQFCEESNPRLQSDSVDAQTSAALPSPCEMFRLTSQAVAAKGAEYSYVLRSFQPLNPHNAPETEVERKGLQFISTRPDLIYSSEELLGGRWYFTAVYPDVAINQSCTVCHNAKKSAGEKQHQMGDVMGGLVVRLALEL
jgi:hypothetical protein